MSDANVSVSVLRSVLQKFNEDYGVAVNETDRRKLGKVLTVVDASIPDPEQRKAVKDLIQNDWWSGNNDANSFYVNEEIRFLADALGFELYPDHGVAPEASPLRYNRYKDLVK